MKTLLAGIALAALLSAHAPAFATDYTEGTIERMTMARVHWLSAERRPSAAIGAARDAAEPTRSEGQEFADRTFWTKPYSGFAQSCTPR
jgi:hypothetical protein